MKHREILIESIISAALLLFIFARDAHAYLDPGTGSFILQMLLAGLFAVLLAIRIFWNKIKALFTRHSSRNTEDEVGHEDVDG